MSNAVGRCAAEGAAAATQRREGTLFDGAAAGVSLIGTSCDISVVFGVITNGGKADSSFTEFMGLSDESVFATSILELKG